MARISRSLFNVAENIFNSAGLGNQSIFLTFCLASFITLLGIIGFYLPGLAFAINLFIPLIIGGGTFIAISLFTLLNPVAVFFGLIVGVMAGALSSAICSMILSLAPPLVALLIIPNVLAATFGALGYMAAFVESCFSRVFGDNYKAPTRSKQDIQSGSYNFMTKLDNINPPPYYSNNNHYTGEHFNQLFKVDGFNNAFLNTQPPQPSAPIAQYNY